MPIIWGNIAKKAAQAGQKALVTYQAGKAAQAVKKKPVVKKQVAKPPIKTLSPNPMPEATPYYSIFGMRVNKTAAHVTGLLALAGTAVYIGKRMSR